MSAFVDAEFPPEVLGEILIRAGSWSPALDNAVEEEDHDGAALGNAHHVAKEAGEAAAE